jgi:hypothetical protein
MLVGHTKLSPDRCFGLFKQRYRRTIVSCLEDAVDVVNSSADVNVAQLVGTQSGETVVPVYNWAAFLGEHSRHVPHLKTYHHFKFSAAHPDNVILQEFSDTPGSPFRNLINEDWYPDSSELSPLITPVGLSHPRQTYLYQQIREFCRPGTEDLTCPQPASLHDSSSSEDENGHPLPPRAKRVPRCGKCGGAGHTQRTCTEHYLYVPYIPLPYVFICYVQAMMTENSTLYKPNV